MNVVDSSAWLEYFADGPNAAFFAEPIEDIEALVVPTLSLFEVFKRVLQQRDESTALEAAAVMQQGTVVDLEATIALNAARLSVELRLPLADSVILATARQYGAELWTQDADFEGIEGVRYRKRKPWQGGERLHGFEDQLLASDHGTRLPVGQLHHRESSGSSRAVDGGCSSLPLHFGFAVEGIQEIDPELVKIAHVSGHDRQPMYQGRCRDHCVLQQRVGTAMLEPRPFPECGGVHWENVIGNQHRAEPGFQFLRLDNILVTGEFDARLDFPDRHRRQKEFIGGHLSRPY